MFELLFILLPVAAAYGYYMGHAAAGSRRQDDQRLRHSSYLHGVEFLLSHEQEQAVDQFIACLDSETNPTFENSMALGSLFRARGETDRAIALHEALSSDTQLEQSDHELARIELARDFVAAGLVDRAESILLELVDIPRMRGEAAELLMRLYELGRDYSRAVATAMRYRGDLSDAALLRLSHYYCELAEHELLAGNLHQGRVHFTRALDAAPQSIRPRLGLCRIELREHAPGRAWEQLQQAIRADAGYGPLCLGLLRECFPDPGDPGLRQALDELARRCQSASAMASLVELVAQTSRSDAEELLLAFLRDKPNLRLFSQLMQLHAGTDGGGGVLLQLKSLVDAEIARKALYACRSCGFESQILFWQCPSCRHWESMRTQHGLDGD